MAAPKKKAPAKKTSAKKPKVEPVGVSKFEEVNPEAVTEKYESGPNKGVRKGTVARNTKKLTRAQRREITGEDKVISDPNRTIPTQTRSQLTRPGKSSSKPLAETTAPVESDLSNYIATGTTPTTSGSIRVVPENEQRDQADTEKKRKKAKSIADKAAGIVPPKGIQQIKGISDRHTTALQHDAQAQIDERNRQRVYEAANQLEGIGPEWSKRQAERLKEAQQEHEEDQKRVVQPAYRGIGALIQRALSYRPSTVKELGNRAVKKGEATPLREENILTEGPKERRDEDAYNRELNRAKGRSDITKFGAASWEPDAKSRNLTPHAIENYESHLIDQRADFFNRREAVQRMGDAAGYVAAYKEHFSDKEAINQCGNPHCVEAQRDLNQRANTVFMTPENISAEKSKILIAHHLPEVISTMDRTAEKYHEAAKTRYDESRLMTDQPTHKEEDCPFVHTDEQGAQTPVLIHDPQYNVNRKCTGHIDENRINEITGKPVQSDFHFVPHAVHIPEKTLDPATGDSITIYHEHRAPGAEYFINDPEYTKPGGIEETYSLLHNLTQAATSPEKREEFGEYADTSDLATRASRQSLDMQHKQALRSGNADFIKNTRESRNTRAMTHRSLRKAIANALESGTDFKKMVTERMVGDPTAASAEYTPVDVVRGKEGSKKGRQVKVSQPLSEIESTGATDLVRPGYSGLGAATRRSGKVSKRDVDEQIHALATFARAHVKRTRTQEHDFRDLMENAVANAEGTPEEKLHRLQQSVATDHALWDTVSSAILGAHAQREGVKTVSRSKAQAEYGKREGRAFRQITPSEAGFASEGRERNIGDTFGANLTKHLVDTGNQIAQIAGTITKNTREFIPLSASGGNRGSGVPNSMPVAEPRRNPANVEEEPEPTLTSYSTTGAPVAPKPTVKTAEETEADIAAYAAKKKAQRKAAKNTPPPDATLQ